jgi:hypothetical protein
MKIKNASEKARKLNPPKLTKGYAFGCRWHNYLTEQTWELQNGKWVLIKETKT